jgi:transposase
MANRRGEALTDEQWAIIGPLIPEVPRREDGRGRPWRDTREVMNGVLWILRSSARWQDLPDRFPPYRPATADSSNGRAMAHYVKS